MAFATSVWNRPDPLEDLDERAALFRGGMKDPDVRAVFDKVLESLDRAQYRTLQARYAADVPAGEKLGQYKYLDICYFVAGQARKAKQIGLLTGKPKRVLDIGSGGGHLLAICKAYGHDPIGLDVQNDFYQDMCDLYGVRRLDDGVQFGVSFPPAVGKRDVILATALSFDYHRSNVATNRWSVQEWATFLEYVTKVHMNYPGLLYLEVNPGDNVVGHQRTHPLEALFQLCAGAGAVVDGRSIRFDLNSLLTFDGAKSA